MALTAPDLAAEFGVTEQAVTAWAAQGMPLDRDEAARWLVDHGLAELDDGSDAESDLDDLLPTRAAIAGVLEVSGTSAGTLVSRADFPPGPPWSRAAVLAWQAAQKSRPADGATGGTVTAKDQREQIKLELDRLKLEQARGDVLPLDEIVAEMTRQHALAVQKLNGLTNLLIGLLPPDTAPEVVADFRRRSNKIITDAKDDIATAFRREADEDV